MCAKVIAGTIFLTYFWTVRISRRRNGASRSAIDTTITVLMAVFGNTSATLLANRSIATRPTAPLSENWCTISAGVYSGLVFTMIKPALRIPNTAMGYARQLGIWMATRSPGLKPATSRRYTANSSDRRSTSA